MELVESWVMDEPFERIYTAELRAVTRLAYLLVRVPTVAEELAQEAFTRLFEHFDEVESPAGWVRTTVVRLAIGWQRRQQTERTAVGWPERPPLAEPELDDMWAAIGRLERPHQTVLVLRFYEDMPFRDIAALLGCTAATARSRARRAVAALRHEVTL